MDGLPIHEPAGGSGGAGGFQSENEGWMHACGHDAHMTMALGAAKLLKAAKDAGELPPGTVRVCGCTGGMRAECSPGGMES